MTTPRTLHDELDPPFLRRQQWTQRALWLAMVAIIGAALLGYFGSSPRATEVERVEADGAVYVVDHPRFTRYQFAERMHVRVEAPQAQGEELKVTFSRVFVENNAVTGVTPDSDGGGVGADGSTYSFKVEDWSQPVIVAFQYEPRKAFSSPGELTIQAGESAPVKVNVDQWVYP